MGCGSNTRNMYTVHQSRTQCHVPAHVTFRRVVFFVTRVRACQRLSHAQHVHVAEDESRLEICTWSVVSSQKHLSSHVAQHGTQYTFSDDSAIIEHFLTSLLHSNPPFDQTFKGTSAGFIFWRDLPLRRTNKCVFRFFGRSALAYRLCRQIHLTRHFSLAQDKPPNVSVLALHSIFMPSMMCA